MGRFNLLDEPWISVMADDKGNTKEVSLKEVFEHAHEYCGLAGDTKTQDFAVFRVLLAVLHTVFSRFDENGEEYGYFDLDERWKPLGEVSDEDDAEEYEALLYGTWQELWNRKQFPAIIGEYLEKWRDRFYLFDEVYPFYQVVSQDLAPDKINKSKASVVSGKNINRRISESGNKTALFSPKYEANQNKEKLIPADIARWLMTFQCYTGLSDKVIFGNEKYKASKGWLFDIGGIFLEGDTLYESLLLNCVFVHPNTSYRNKEQRPCWEYDTEEIVERLLQSKSINNLAELYTNWSRAIYIDPNIDYHRAFSFEIVKLPEIQHENQFLELMTLWRFNTSGDSKDCYTPRKHRANQSMWRSFGLITLSYEAQDAKDKKNAQRKPGIIDWLNAIKDLTSDFQLSLAAVSMKDDGNATSWVPVDEIVDYLNIRETILTDIEEAGWVMRINDAIEETKSVIDWVFKSFISDIKEIRNVSNHHFVDRKVEEFYFNVDQPFRDWLSSLQPLDSKDEKIFEWRRHLKELALNQAKKVLEEAGPRDYTGIVKDDKIKNIATVYNLFLYRLNGKLTTGGETNDGKER